MTWPRIDWVLVAAFAVPAGLMMFVSNVKDQRRREGRLQERVALGSIAIGMPMLFLAWLSVFVALTLAEVAALSVSSLVCGAVLGAILDTINSRTRGRLWPVAFPGFLVAVGFLCVLLLRSTLAPRLERIGASQIRWWVEALLVGLIALGAVIGVVAFFDNVYPRTFLGRRAAARRRARSEAVRLAEQRALAQKQATCRHAWTHKSWMSHTEGGGAVDECEHCGLTKNLQRYTGEDGR